MFPYLWKTCPICFLDKGPQLLCQWFQTDLSLFSSFHTFQSNFCAWQQNQLISSWNGFWLAINSFSIEPYFLGTKESFFWKFVAEADISFCRIFCSSTLLKKRVLRHLLHFIEEVFESHSIDLTTTEPILICKQTVYLFATRPEFPKSSKSLNLGLLKWALERIIQSPWFYSLNIIKV